MEEYIKKCFLSCCLLRSRSRSDDHFYCKYANDCRSKKLYNEPTKKHVKHRCEK